MMDRIEQFRQSFTTRKTEKVDTRQAIQRHDPDYYKKKKEDDEEGGFKDPYEDLTNVSVNALIAFLEGLLDRIQPDHGKIKSDFSQPNHPQNRPADSPKTAAAMNAYQTRAGNAPPKQENNQSQTTDNTPATALDSAIASLDPNELKATIRDLRGLIARGINEIALERGDGFLESIQTTVQKFR